MHAPLIAAASVPRDGSSAPSSGARLSSLVRVDLHLHSSASFDCRMTSFQVARRCARLGISPVFLTDHDTTDGAVALRSDTSAPVIAGEEVTTVEGEIIGLFLDQPVPPGLPTSEAVRRIKAQGGLIYLQHPFDSFRRRLDEQAIEAIADEIDIVEVFNGRSDAEANRKAEELRELLGVPAGAGSDAHVPGEIGLVYVEMERFLGARDFLDKLARARIVRHPNRWLLTVRARLGAYRRR